VFPAPGFEGKVTKLLPLGHQAFAEPHLRGACRSGKCVGELGRWGRWGWWFWVYIDQSQSKAPRIDESLRRNESMRLAFGPSISPRCGGDWKSQVLVIWTKKNITSLDNNSIEGYVTVCRNSHLVIPSGNEKMLHWAIGNQRYTRRDSINGRITGA
jgi:hypothetical protein